jgi:hypothetical protein
MFFEKCTENCGWIAAIVASIGFGSFGVPIKKVSHINVDPLVMQVRSLHLVLRNLQDVMHRMLWSLN